MNRAGSAATIQAPLTGATERASEREGGCGGLGGKAGGARRRIRRHHPRRERELQAVIGIESGKSRGTSSGRQYLRFARLPSRTHALPFIHSSPSTPHRRQRRTEGGAGIIVVHDPSYASSSPAGLFHLVNYCACCIMLL